MNIDSRHSVRHHFLLAGSGERAAVTLSRVAGYRRSLRGRQRRPIIRSITHAPDQTETQPRLLQCRFDLASPGRRNLTSDDFHKLSRAGGPKGLKRVHPTGTERQSLTKECGWKDGDRGGLAQTQKISWEEKRKTDLTLTGLLMEGLIPQSHRSSDHHEPKPQCYTAPATSPAGNKEAENAIEFITVSPRSQASSFASCDPRRFCNQRQTFFGEGEAIRGES